jgi:uncharacterized membrane protein
MAMTSTAAPRAVNVRRDRVVAVPADVLWQLVEPAETLPAWLTLFDTAVRLDGAGLGRRQRVTARWGRRVVTIDQEVVGYEENARLSWTHVDERIGDRPAPRISARVTTTLRLEPAGPATRVVLESRHEPAGWMAGLLLRLVARRRIERAFDRALATLAACGG